MNRKDIRRAQLRQLDSLKFIDKICRENSLKYFVHTGTLLGAIREHGYIPWDMDTDLLMPEDDCLQLLKLIKRRSDPKYSVVLASEGACLSDRILINNAYLIYNKTDKCYMHIGICSYASAKNFSWLERSINKKITHLLANVIGYRHKTPDTSFFNKIIIGIANKLCYPFSDEDIRDFIKMHAVSKQPTDFITVYNSFYGFIKETYPSWYFEKTELVCFEDIKVPVPIGYDKVLSALYGDWRTPPPEGKRYSKELNDIVYREE